MEAGTSRDPSLALRASVLLLAAVLAGCQTSTPELDSTYGRRASKGAESVSGTAALADLFASAGHRVYTREKLSPFINSHRVIVWAPDSFSPPDAAVVDYLDRWLSGGPDRVLIYIGRDYDGASDYWSRVLPQVPAADAPEAARQLALARSRHAMERNEVSDGARCNWFKLDTTGPRRTITEDDLDGEWAGAAGDAPVRIELGHRLVSDSAGSTSYEVGWEPLLMANNDPLISRVTKWRWPEGRVYVVANGSFLLNLPLVDAANRRLAQKLIAECGPAESVVFLQTDQNAKIIAVDGEEDANPYAWLTVFPVGVILMHIFFLGILLCAVAFPVFGRPRSLPVESRSDFGAHVAALGELLERTDNADFARRQIDQYKHLAGRETTRGAVGISTGGKKR